MTADGPDLVVAGAGGGLVAALRAASCGLSVLVVERNEHFAVGNNTAMSTAMVPGAGTRWQRAQAIEDSPQTFVADIMAKTHGEADARLAASAGRGQRAPGRVAGRRPGPADVPGDRLPLPGALAAALPHRARTAGRTCCATLVRARPAGATSIDLMVPARLTDVGSTAASGVEEVVVAVRTVARSGSRPRRCCSPPTASAPTGRWSPSTCPRSPARSTTAARAPPGRAAHRRRARRRDRFPGRLPGPRAPSPMPAATLAGLGDGHARRPSCSTGAAAASATRPPATPSTPPRCSSAPRDRPGSSSTSGCTTHAPSSRTTGDTVGSGAVRWADDVEGLAAHDRCATPERWPAPSTGTSRGGRRTRPSSAGRTGRHRLRAALRRG